ncbi:putative E3 ubiquitin-protein ligase LIN-1 [Solanum pennellii]|uniref:E3 ubiquitin-protein ligase LIN-1 n=1 Tax=Solanum pennellii TaxID=28526 RepID=A0ABM1FRK4_SOLPN|nr:putative E3 ubiquitin-protein ligase LIN-1 [Solanum pennellii]
MSHNSMATLSSSTPPVFSYDDDKLDLESVRKVVVAINQHITALLADTKSWKSLKLKCSSKLDVCSNRGYLEFSEQSILSNLYWGIESIEAALQAKWSQERTSRLQNSEIMLQVPASLDEHGETAGIPNSYLTGYSYFYLSVVRKLQEDEWQVAMHFLQALAVSPRLLHTEIATELCRQLSVFCIEKEPYSKDENEVYAMMVKMARRYKAWLMYYQIMSFGEDGSLRNGESSSVTSTQHELQQIMSKKSRSTRSSDSCKNENKQCSSSNFEKVHPFNAKNDAKNEKEDTIITSNECTKEKQVAITELSGVAETPKNITTKCLKDILLDSESETFDFSSSSSASENFHEEYAEDMEITSKRSLQNQQTEDFYQNQKSSRSSLFLESLVCKSQVSGLRHNEGNRVEITNSLSRRFSGSFSHTDLSAEGIRGLKTHIHMSGNNEAPTMQQGLQMIDSKSDGYPMSMTLRDYQLCKTQHPRISSRQKNRCKKTLKEISEYSEENSQEEQAALLEKIISKLCFSEEFGDYKDYTVDLTTIYELLNNKTGLKYSLLKDIIIDQLLRAISTSREEHVIRESVSVLSIIISRNRSLVDDVKRKGLQLNHLATALKKNVHEAAILIYLINPSPAEIKTLELLPCLVDVVCASNNYKCSLRTLRITPPAASLMIMEALVTAFDYTSSETQLAVISSPEVLSGLLDVSRNNNLEEIIALAAVLIRCMQFDGQCRKQINHSAPLAPFISLLRSNHERATSIALEFFHELLRIPRSSAIEVLQKIQQDGSNNNKRALLLLIQKSQPEYKILAANLLLQLDMLEETSGKFVYCEEATEALLESVSCEENSATQALSAFILSNLGGTFSWSGEPYTIPWLLKKAGLTSLPHKNMIKNVDFSDKCLQDNGIETWCSKVARRFLKFGSPLFHALEKGLESESRSTSRDYLAATAWLGSEITKAPDGLRYAACEILLSRIEQFVHPGLELEERLLGCLCIYYYTSGRGMKKLVNFSEGVRESLRRLSNMSWMAEELLKVADYIQPNKWRISCVHTQILEMSSNHSGAVTSLTYYNGELYSGHADGSIKAWDIKGQEATLVRDVREHKKAVTCFTISESGNCLLSGSADKSIKIWQMFERKLECTETILTKDPIQNINTHGELIFAVTQSHKMKVFDGSRKASKYFKNKSIRCGTLINGKLYIGCTDSSIQELAIPNSRQQEIKAPSKSWSMKNKAVNSLAVYKDWLYSASSTIEASLIKDWKKNKKPQISMSPEKGGNVLAMEVVEDFIYLNCSVSMSNIQIWLRGTQHKVGRLSAGSKITSLLTANDIIICGTETGMIKGWIPL